MKTKFLIIALMAFATFGFSQGVRTLASHDGLETITFGGYGGPFVQATQINNDWGIIIGGKGAVVINGRFAFGGIGMLLVDGIDFLGDDLTGDNNASLILDYGAGGLYCEYLFKSEGPIHFSIPVNFMAGGIYVNDATTHTELESTGVFVIEPGINLEFKVSRHFIPGISLSYRQVFGCSLVNLGNQDIAGVNIGLIFKSGNY